eukprot:CAMPEP_0168557168 /NCGR_PEP_ID=MMETSP0413-20121227/9276_1 /TAXON_ID=136452 /ORGANISM="Filamoeba nolandi, Strain NC-AS-23-1" /LENGTH=458 /DNA_ID=CAMNT_0008588171 /DNA_START=91 /DNA_END=1463 /DNA_ORIENTATION=+
MLNSIKFQNLETDNVSISKHLFLNLHKFISNAKTTEEENSINNLDLIPNQLLSSKHCVEIQQRYQNFLQLLMEEEAINAKESPLKDAVEALQFCAATVFYNLSICDIKSLEHLKSRMQLMAQHIAEMHSKRKRNTLIQSIIGINDLNQFWNVLFELQKTIQWKLINKNNAVAYTKDPDFNTHWLLKLTLPAVSVLKLFQTWKQHPDVVASGIPLVLWSRANTKQAPLHLACLGTSWSDRDFPSNQPLQYFEWAKTLMKDFNAATTLDEQKQLAGLWLEGCASYFDEHKPCHRWFARMLLVLKAIEHHWFARNRQALSFGTSFWDFVPLPTKAFGDISKDEQIKMLNAGFPVCLELFQQISVEECPILLILIHSRTHGTPTTELLDSSKLKLIHDLQLFAAHEKVLWTPVHKVYSVEEHKWYSRHNLYALQVEFKHRPGGNDWILISQGWNQYFHPLIS